MKRARVLVAAAVLVSTLVVAGPAGAGADRAATPRDDGDVAAHWTPARMAAAIPRDLVVDQRGLGYLRRPDGSLQPHGHSTTQLWAAPTPAARPTPAAKPGGGGGGDTTGPTVTGFDPDGTAPIGASHTFKATVTDPSGVRSVTVTIRNSSGQTQSFAATKGANDDVWSVGLNGFTDGQWSWRVVAKDAARKPNTTTTGYVDFTVSTGSGGGGGGTSTVVNDPWPGTGIVQTAAGRLYFEMPANSALTRWSGYVCSGTVATDGVTGRSVIITAAHCVYDDVEKVFARNVLFIPDQDHTTGAGTDLTCSNDPLGCWTPSFGVVDVDWTTRTFPANIPWDYAYYVVPDSGAHTNSLAANEGEVLDAAAGHLGISFTLPTEGAVTDAIGYSYSDDPNLMYCSEDLASEMAYGDWWLGQCGLSGGASGGPWLQPPNDGSGPIVSVNSWGYSNQPGMAGPVLSGGASCVFDLATARDFPTDGTRGYAATCP